MSKVDRSALLEGMDDGKGKWLQNFEINFSLS